MWPPERQPPGQHLLPDDALRCVWMTAGLVAYKLCDRHFDCEHCSFDTVMRGQRVDEVPEPAPVQNVAAELEFRDDRRYHPAHTWAQSVEGDRLRIGIDSFAARLIGRTTSAILPPSGALVHRGRIGCWLLDDLGPLPLKMPVSGTVLCGNKRLRSYPSLAAESPYDEGWLVEVAPIEAAQEMAFLLSAAEMRRRSQADLARFRRQAAAYVRRGAQVVGLTLADGGERLATLRDMLGEPCHRRLVMQFLD